MKTSHSLRIQSENLKFRYQKVTLKILFFSFLFLATSTGYAQQLDEEKLNQFFERLQEKNKAMGSVVISQNGQPFYTCAIGYSFIEETEKKPISMDTRFRVGSITKTFTATMIFQLIEEGKLGLEDPLEQFFPQVPRSEKITIRHLLQHRSGIGDVMEIEEFRDHRFKALSRDKLIEIISTATPGFEPGTDEAYSNSGYILLGAIVEEITGKSYKEALSERVTSKLGLKDTYVGTEGISPAKNESYSYRYQSDWVKQPETHNSLLFGSGALTSTPNDLVKFIHSLFQLELLSQESLDLMSEEEMGLSKFTYNGKTLYGHTGGIDGFGSWLVYLPAEKLAVAYASNGKVYPVSKIIDGVLDIYWNIPFEIPSFESVVVAQEILDKYTGTYARPGAPVKFRVARNEGTLYVEMLGDPENLPLEAISEDKFRLQALGVLVLFDAGKQQMIMQSSGGQRVFTKIK